eukprot:171205-Chlamydomonas_euryale.AAC.1
MRRAAFSSSTWRTAPTACAARRESSCAWHTRSAPSRCGHGGRARRQAGVSSAATTHALPSCIPTDFYGRRQKRYFMDAGNRDFL